jgi:hypothetical protein
MACCPLRLATWASDAKLRAFRRTTATANMVREGSIQCSCRSMMLSTSFKCLVAESAARLVLKIDV